MAAGCGLASKPPRATGAISAARDPQSRLSAMVKLPARNAMAGLMKMWVLEARACGPALISIDRDGIWVDSECSRNRRPARVAVCRDAATHTRTSKLSRFIPLRWLVAPNEGIGPACAWDPWVIVHVMRWSFHVFPDLTHVIRLLRFIRSTDAVEHFHVTKRCPSVGLD